MNKRLPSLSKAGAKLKPDADPETMRRRAYQRAYYLAHKEKAKNYQKRYNELHKVKKGKRYTKSKFVRETIKSSYTASDLLKMPASKMVHAVSTIVNEDATYVGVR